MRRALICAAVLSVAILLVASTPAADAAVRKCAGKRVTIVGTSQPDNIRGTRRADVIDGLAGDDRIFGLGGNDIICGGFGSDYLRGDGGADSIYGGRDGFDVLDTGTIRNGDQLRGGYGNDTLVPGVDPRSGADSVVPDRILYDTSPRRVVVNLSRGWATGNGTDRLVVNGPIGVTTTRFADRVTGSRFDDSIRVQGGADNVSAGAGNDTIVTYRELIPSPPDEDADQAIGGPGNDVLRSLGGHDVLKGGQGNDTLYRTADGGGRLEGGPGNDFVSADTTPDSTAANVPAEGEHVDGGGGADLVWVLHQTDPVPPATLDIATGHFHLGTQVPMDFALSGFEAYAFHGGAWQVSGSGGDDFVDGRFAASVRMTGLAGDDTLRGSYGADIFDGGDGTGDCFQHNPAPEQTTDALTAVEIETNPAAPCAWPSVPTNVARLAP